MAISTYKVFLMKKKTTVLLDTQTVPVNSIEGP